MHHLNPNLWRLGKTVAAAFGFLWVAASQAGGLDHRLNFDGSGIWARPKQNLVQFGSAAVVLGGALWEGSDTRLGKTFWKAAEAMLAAEVAAEGIKRLTRRARPIENNDPGDWFGPASRRSFPSGEVTRISAIVTPFIAEYAREQPVAWALAALPVYVSAARLKSQAHWQTDVLAGVALGAGIGYYESTRESAISVGVLPRGVTIGISKRF